MERQLAENLFKSYSRGMLNISLRMLGNRQDAEDVLQDAMIQAYTNLKSLKSVESFGPWMKRIVINQCLHFIRGRLNFADLQLVNTPGESDETDYYQFSMEELNSTIQQLPDGCRIVFNLYLLENYSHKEVAEMLGISESTSKSQYQRARQLLQHQLKKKMNHG
ncbi:MAG: sigma-70 family RNA polymerase sigma factor [Bacteroidales bacterium]|nr:sigma-70 family RNA polymerase sigma factor [Bacteroidales bacterium]